MILYYAFGRYFIQSNVYYIKAICFLNSCILRESNPIKHNANIYIYKIIKLEKPHPSGLHFTLQQKYKVIVIK